MSKRLNQNRESLLQPKRVASCKRILIKMGYEITYEDDTKLEFMHNGSKVEFYPYSGWHTGKSIFDGRGFINLIKQLEQK